MLDTPLKVCLVSRNVSLPWCKHRDIYSTFGSRAGDTITVKTKFHYTILVADRSEAGRRPAASWNLAYHQQRASTS